MTARVLRAADRGATPWRNGGGVTRDIAVAPEGAAAGAFDWRISLAEVAGDGPFSLFPGIDRTLTVVEGEGMDLLVGGEHHIVDEPLWPHDFPGDRETHGRLLHGPVVNLNVMYRRDRVPASTAVVRGSVRLIPPDGGTVVAVALEDGAVFEGAAPEGAPGGGTDLRLLRHDAVLVTGAPAGVLRTHGYAAVVTLPGR
ncbi:HutD family protein [Streptomyces sp. B1I3]|uniref:HutD/Ves family protein n=1 Tax=Streptomyces sp. B1I3 TaxID=3042264 RepID=UPI0027883520|nr:HutD family protein [Streptomyces sp. B1I3]MDQ0796928.1 environmental stress-induced protein Ves [Streptomyces sp. B1I3]